MENLEGKDKGRAAWCEKRGQASVTTSAGAAYPQGNDGILYCLASLEASSPSEKSDGTLRVFKGVRLRQSFRRATMASCIVARYGDAAIPRGVWITFSCRESADFGR